MSNSDINEIRIWKNFQLGDRDALGLIFEKYYPGLYRYGLKVTHSEQLAEDSVQALFLYLFEHRSTTAVPVNTQAYLFRALRRRLIHLIRDRQKHRDKLKTFYLHQIDIQFSQEEVITSIEQKERRTSILVQMINSLPRRQREAIFLRYYEGLDVREVSEVLGITYQGAVNTLYKGIKALRKHGHLSKLSMS